MKQPFVSLPFYEGDDPLKWVPRLALPVEGATGYPLAGVPIIERRSS
jgi:hypothetical protein